MKRCLTVGVLVLLVSGVAFVGEALAQKKPVEAFTDPDKAGPDFVIQGEYEGTVGDGDKEKLAAQVIADGDGKFTVNFLFGGLPGAGSEGKKKIKAAATTEEGKTTITGTWAGEISNGKLTGKTPEGVAFSLARVVRKSPTMEANAPENALILFDGGGVDEWNGGKIVEEHLLGVGATTKKTFRDFKLHVEFRLPFMPRARGQNRCNSGVYLQNRYEIQVLDSFGLEGKPNECGGVYEQTAPLVNMCFPPLQWQTYDIDFHAARFDTDGKKTANARVTVLHNGVKVHDDVEIKKQTGYGQPEKDTPGPIYLQNHGSPVVYRNIWLVPGAP
jgi:hypothetical protein